MSGSDALTIVREFCAAWDRLDWEAVYAALDEDIVYHNIPMPPCRGIAEFKAFIAGFPVSKAQFEIHHIVDAGDVVMTERTDRFELAGKTIVIRVMGVFVLKGGRIAEWRDYFDLAEFMQKMPAA